MFYIKKYKRIGEVKIANDNVGIEKISYTDKGREGSSRGISIRTASAEDTISM